MQGADEDKTTEVGEEAGAVHTSVVGKGVEVVVDEGLAGGFGDTGLGLEEEGHEVVLECAFAATLVIDEVGLAFMHHDVAGLKVAVHEPFVLGGEKEAGEGFKVFFQSLFVKGDAGQLKEVIFEVGEVPAHGL